MFPCLTDNDESEGCNSQGRGVRRGSGLDEVDAEILVGSSACQNVVGSVIRADREAQLVEIERLEREASTGRLER